MSVQVIEKNGKPEWVVLPYEEYQRLMEEVEMLQDIRAYDEAKGALSAGKEETVPSHVLEALLAGQNPIRVWREYRGLSRKELAARAHISPTYLARLERGERRGTLRVLLRLAEALSVDVEDLI